MHNALSSAITMLKMLTTTLSRLFCNHDPLSLQHSRRSLFGAEETQETRSSHFSLFGAFCPNFLSGAFCPNFLSSMLSALIFSFQCFIFTLISLDFQSSILSIHLTQIFILLHFSTPNLYPSLIYWRCPSILFPLKAID